MNKPILSFLPLFSFILAFGQYNVPVNFNEDYCHHIKSCENQLNYYNTPLVSNALLEKYDVSFYFLDINVESNTIALGGNVTIKAQSTVAALDTFAFELASVMTIDSVFVNNTLCPFEHNNDLATVPLASPIPQGTLFSVKICYHGTPPSGGFFSGITTDYSALYQQNVTWTLSEPYAAKDWWPTKQDLQDKADSVWVFLTTSPENKAGSEGLLTGVTTMPDGKIRYEWKSHYPIDYYLISFAVADYQEYNIYAFPEGTDDSVLIQNFIYDHPNCLPDNKAGIDMTAAFIELYSNLFGLYPFINEKYGHCLTELGGGMEHQTMTTLGGFGFGLVAHELGHMWFGDKVTCATWSDIWINEGFATYTDYLAHSYLADPIYDSIWLRVRHDKVKEQPGGSVYVPPEQLGDIWRIFDDRLSYSKGALLLHMIRFELQDDEMFFNVLKTYVQEYGDSVATGDDFREWLESVSGRDFTDFFNQWYYGEGYPVYDIVWHQGGGSLDIVSTQTTSTAVTPLFKMLTPYHLIFSDGTDTTLLLYQDANLNSFTVPIAKTIYTIEFDPKQWILHKLNSLSLGLEERANPVHFTIGPNPATNYINIFFSHKPGKTISIIISDLTGRIVLNEETANSSYLIDVSHLMAGIYQVSVTDGAEKMSKKLILE
jgi:aminopeptidase N